MAHEALHHSTCVSDKILYHARRRFHCHFLICGHIRARFNNCVDIQVWRQSVKSPFSSKQLPIGGRTCGCNPAYRCCRHAYAGAWPRPQGMPMPIPVPFALPTCSLAHTQNPAFLRIYGLGPASVKIQCAARCRRARNMVKTCRMERERDRQNILTARQALLLDWLHRARAQMLAKVGDRLLCFEK